MRMRSAKSRRSAVRPVYRVYAQVTTQSTSVAPRKSTDAVHKAPVAWCCTPSFETLLDQEGARQRQERVDHDQPEADEERAAVGTQERPEPEVLAPRGLGGDVDVGLVVGRWQRVDRGQQLGGVGAEPRCPPPAPHADAAAAPEAASRHCRAAARCDDGAHPVGLGRCGPTAPR